jgi:hypothetical protein
MLSVSRGFDPQNLFEHLPWDGDLGHPKGNIAAVAVHLARSEIRS